MIHELQRESMDIDNPRKNEDSPCMPKENGVHLYPVSINDSGEGLPYAPEDWPNPGDKWVWKAGRRIAVSGFFMDRYLYLPRRFRQAGQGRCFASRLSLEQYVQKHFPDVDVDAFFSSFSWKIPSKAFRRDNKEIFRNHSETSEHPVSDSPMGGCKAGNKFCSSLDTGEDSVLEIMFCDICCSEPSFCRDCCCILCSRTINKALGAHSYIRCEATIDGYICGHNCHIDCALRGYMAGTVGGSIGLEAEYYCCRCDSRTDLVSHVTKLLQTCESIDSRDDIEKILNVGICVLRGSTKTSAHQLLNSIDKAMLKLKNGTYIEDIWKKEDASAVDDGDFGTGHYIHCLPVQPSLPFNFKSEEPFLRSQELVEGQIFASSVLLSEVNLRAYGLSSRAEDPLDRVIDDFEDSAAQPDNQEMRDLFAQQLAADEVAKAAKRTVGLAAAKEKAKGRAETDEAGAQAENVILIPEEEERSEDHTPLSHRKRKAVADSEIVLGTAQEVLQTAQPSSFPSHSAESSRIPDFSIPSSSGPRGNILLEGASGTGYQLLKSNLSPAEETFLKDMRAGDQMLEGLNRSISGLHMVIAAFDKVANAYRSAENRAQSSKNLHNQLLVEVTRARDLHFRELAGVRQSLDSVQEQLEESQNNLHLSRAETESAQARADQLEREVRAAEDDARSANARAGRTEEEWKTAIFASPDFQNLVAKKAYPFFKIGFKKCRDQVKETGLLPPEKKHMMDFRKAVASLPADGMEGEEDTDTDEKSTGPGE